MVNNTAQVDSTTGKRKINKPLIEKKRRARINNCLLQLKKLVLEATGRNSESALQSKLEKADILEMTVQYLERLQRGQSSSGPASTSVMTPTPYKVGYSLCTNQAVRYVELNGTGQHSNSTNEGQSSCFSSELASKNCTDSITCRLAGHLNDTIRCNLSLNGNRDFNDRLDTNSHVLFSPPRNSRIHCQQTFEITGCDRGRIDENESAILHGMNRNLVNLECQQISSENPTLNRNEQLQGGLEINTNSNNFVWRPW